ncbi:chaplin [Streptomyces sp. NPDC048696]|uniref:chaplin n=1 Tax=Streptomyces sp. NPDC048696 TaxID=3365585 RepID=UPI0037208F0A
MTNPKKYLVSALVGATLSVGFAAPALAADGPGHHGYGDERNHHSRDHHGYGDRDDRDRRDHHSYGDRDRDRRDHHSYGDRNRFDESGTTCRNEDGGAEAFGRVSDSPGFLSGNLFQIPINIPINVCGNSIGIL